MEKIKLSKKLITIILISLLCLSAALTTLICLIKPNTNSITTTDTTSFVKVNNGEDLWTGSGINKDTANELFKMLGNSSTADYNTLQSSVTSSSPKSAGVLRGYTYGKNSGQSIIVRLGGLDWIVTYLSVSDEDADYDGNNDIIATLWLTNNEQDAWQSMSTTVGSLGKYYGFIKSSVTGKIGLYADWAANWYSSNSYNYSYPSNMYGTSYISTVVLNNGGNYATGVSTVREASTDSNGYGINNPFYSFTTPVLGTKNDLTDFIVTPNNVSWQNTIQDKSLIGFDYHCPNDSLSITGGNFILGNNYSSKTNYTAWGDDYLWLPSLVETGYTDSNDGIWETITSERMSYDGSTTSSLGSGILINSENTSNISASGNIYNYAWVRSAYINGSDYAYSLYPSGANSDYYYVNNSQAVRPALHLNLKSVYSGGPPDLWDYDNQSFDSKYSKPFMQSLTSDGSGKLDQIVADISNSGGEITASELYNRNNSSTYVTLGGIHWLVTYLGIDSNGNPYATLYRADADSTTSWFAGDESASGIDGGSNNSTPSNMYSRSYIRAVTLNAGGTYYDYGGYSSNSSATKTATQSTNNPYTLFTMSTYGLTQHLIQPKYIPYQVNSQGTSYHDIGYVLNNESLSTGGSYSGRNYATNSGTSTVYAEWGNDYVWLPSLSETGYNTSYTGIWQLSVAERYDSINNEAAWLRSAHQYDSFSAYGLIPSSASSATYNVRGSLAVRPSLHLKLKSVYDSLTTTVTLDSQSGTGGTTSVETLGNVPLPTITPPTRDNYIFGGYFSSTNGAGTQYYNADGTSAINYPASGGPTTLYAYWIPLYTLTINSNDSTLGTVYGTAGSYQSSTTHQIYAITKAGYSLLYWSVKNANGTEINKIYENEYTLTMPAHNVTYTAIFGKVIVGVNISSTYGGMVAMVGDNFESLSNSDTITLVATVCVTGYQFKHWINQDGTILASGENNKTYLIPKSLAIDSIITAVFEPIT